MRNLKRAFTLAEVLITLGIIGIVAAMTIPAIMNNIGDAQYKAGVKKEYSMLSQAFERLASENGGSLAGLITGSVDSHNADIIKPYLLYSKACNVSAYSGGCWHKPNNWTTYNGTKISSTNIDENSALVLNDGTLLLISPAGDPGSGGNAWIHYISGCGYDDCADGGYFGTPSNAVLGLMVDLNGFKSPNVIGKDIFPIYVDKSGVLILPKNCSATNGFAKAREYLAN